MLMSFQPEHLRAQFADLNDLIGWDIGPPGCLPALFGTRGFVQTVGLFFVGAEEGKQRRRRWAEARCAANGEAARRSPSWCGG